MELRYCNTKEGFVVDFWKGIMEEMLAVLYHGKDQNGGDWIKDYEYECQSIIDDIKYFHGALTQASQQASDEAMAQFLNYTEFTHIGNDALIKKETVDINRLVIVAAKINNYLNSERQKSF
jgi:hypothetical protein